MKFEINTLFLSNPDVNLHNKTVIDYLGGEYGIYCPSKSQIEFGFTSVSM